MPRNTGVDILSIKPDADLGLAQDSNIPVPAVELTQVNKANDDLRIYDHQINLMKYQQKIKDRDKLLEGLESGQVAVGDIEPEDKRYFDEAEQKSRKAFLAVKSIEPDENGQNKQYEESKAAEQDLKDVANVLQLRRVELQKLRKELAGTISPSERKAREEHLAAQKNKNPFETVTPFQKSLTVELEQTLGELQKGSLISKGQPINAPNTTTTIKDANGKITTTTTEKPPAGIAPAKGKTPTTGITVDENGYLNTEVEIEPDKSWSLEQMTKRANAMYLEPGGEGFAQIQGINDIFQGNPDTVPKEYLKKANERLKLFHQQNEIGSIKIPDKRIGPPSEDPNDTVGKMIDTGEYPYQINYRILPDGRIAIQDTPTDFAAKLALANVAGDYVIKGKKGVNMDAVKFNLEVDKYKADLMNDKGKLAVEWANLGLDRDKFNATNKEDFASAASVINEATSIINKGEPVTVEGGGKTSSTIRISDPTLLNTFGNVDKNGTVTNVPDAINYNKEKNQAVLIYYDKEKAIAEKLGETKKTASGKNIVEKEIPIDQRTWLKHITKRSHPNKDIGNINTQVDVILEKNGNSLYSIAEKQRGGSGTSGKTISTGTIKSLVGSKGYEGYTEQEIIDYYQKNGYSIK